MSEELYSMCVCLAKNKENPDIYNNRTSHQESCSTNSLT